MVSVRLRYVHRFRDRHGRVRYYLRAPGRKQVRLAGEPGSAEFVRSWERAMASAEAAVPKPPASAPGTFDALAHAYYVSPEFLRLRDTTRGVYRRIVEDIRRTRGRSLVAELEPRHIRAMMAAKADRPAAANHLLRTLRAMMRFAVATGLRGDDPTRDVPKLRERAVGIHTWSEDEIAAYEARWPLGTTQRLALALLLYTGQRRSDVVRMGRQHLRGDAIEVRQQKTRAQLLIPIHAELRAALDAAPSDHLTFLITSQGAAFTSAGFYNAFGKWASAAGLPPGRSPHGLRKAVARRMAEAGCTAHEIAAITGHRTLSEVQRYTAAAEQARMAQAAIRKIGKPTPEKPTSLPKSQKR